jgi:hypothetical protein
MLRLGEDCSATRRSAEKNLRTLAAENAARMRSTKIKIVFCWSAGAEGAAQQNCRGEEERPTLREKQEREG